MIQSLASDVYINDIAGKTRSIDKAVRVVDLNNKYSR
jgi:hypothetical protein